MAIVAKNWFCLGTWRLACVSVTSVALNAKPKSMFCIYPYLYKKPIGVFQDYLSLEKVSQTTKLNKTGKTAQMVNWCNKNLN